MGTCYCHCYGNSSVTMGTVPSLLWCIAHNHSIPRTKPSGHMTKVSWKLSTAKSDLLWQSYLALDHSFPPKKCKPSFPTQEMHHSPWELINSKPRSHQHLVPTHAHIGVNLQSCQLWAKFQALLCCFDSRNLILLISHWSSLFPDTLQVGKHLVSGFIGLICFSPHC